MKAISYCSLFKTTFICFLFTANVAFSGGNDCHSLNPKEEIIGATINFFENTMYFNFSIKNEEVSGEYCLVKVEKSGLITILQRKQCVTNIINQVILYSFVQEKVVESEGVRYVLLRISKAKGAEVLHTYGGQMVQDEEKAIAANVYKASL